MVLFPLGVEIVAISVYMAELAIATPTSTGLMINYDLILKLALKTFNIGPVLLALIADFNPIVLVILPKYFVAETFLRLLTMTSIYQMVMT
jgi:hypothetical protein